MSCFNLTLAAFSALVALPCFAANSIPSLNCSLSYQTLTAAGMTQFDDSLKDVNMALNPNTGDGSSNLYAGVNRQETADGRYEIRVEGTVQILKNLKRNSGTEIHVVDLLENIEASDSGQNARVTLSLNRPRLAEKLVTVSCKLN